MKIALRLFEGDDLRGERGLERQRCRQRRRRTCDDATMPRDEQKSTSTSANRLIILASPPPCAISAVDAWSSLL